jgi:uroporphyrin-III C-methyltransferase
LNTNGKVFLVGAGPGDPELLTLKAMKCLERADVVVYDRLVSPEVLALVPQGAARICVGKQPSHHPVPQDEINDLLIRLAASNRNVVRLKGGDPFIFGRGSEEAMELSRAGVGYEVVPGITAAQGCAASLGVPLTHRGLATSVRYVTGHCREDAELDFDWQGLADPDTTLAVYMGRTNIAEITARLIENGLAGATPVLGVCNGTTERARHVLSRLDRIAGRVDEIDFTGPVLFIIGRVANLARIMEPRDVRSDDMVASARA